MANAKVYRCPPCGEKVQRKQILEWNRKNGPEYNRRKQREHQERKREAKTEPAKPKSLISAELRGGFEKAGVM